MNRKLLILVVLAIISSVLLSACATGEEATSTPTVAVEPTDAPTEEAELVETEEAELVETEEAEMVETEEAEMVETEEAEMVETEEAAMTIADLAIATEDLSTLVAAVTVADPAVLATLSGEDDYTVFAPSNEAFAAYLEANNLTAEELLSSEGLTNILLFHTVEGTYTAADLTDGMTLTTLQGGELTVTFGEVDGEEAVLINDAQVIIADVTASNGVVHVINSVLVPPAAEEAATEEAAMATEEMAMTEEVEMVETEAVEMVETEAVEMVETEAVEMVETEEVEMVETEAVEMVETEAVEMVETEAVEMVETEAVEMVETEEPEMVETEEAQMAETVDLSGSIDSVCLVTDLGRVNDGSFNQSAYEGMLNAVRDFNLESTYIETQNQADYAANIDTCLADGFDAIVTVGFLLADGTYAAAQENPEVFFIGVDQTFTSPLPNLVGIQFREDQSGFLAGVMAGLITESNIVGGVYGPDIPPVLKFRNGFENGVKYVNPEARILGVHIGDFLAPAEGAEAAEGMIAEGADVIFGAGGPTGTGGILRAAEQGVRVIGVDQDEYFTSFGAGETPGAENLITSAIKRVDTGVYQMLQALSEGGIGWPTSSLYLMDASVGGVGFAPANEATVPEEITARLNEVLEMLSSGELQTGVDPVSGAFLDGEGAATEEAPAAEEATPEATPES